jgi:hypothetical protein
MPRNEVISDMTSNSAISAWRIRRIEGIAHQATLWQGNTYVQLTLRYGATDYQCICIDLSSNER